jgi:uncharacterized membrane protein
VEKGHVDLTPTTLTALPAGLEEGSTARLGATLKNLGNRAVDVFDYLVEQVDPSGKVTVLESANGTDLGPGLQTQMGWAFTGVRGTHKLRITLDPEDKLPESDEDNNVLEVEYFFKGFGVGATASETEVPTDPALPVDFTVTLVNTGNVPDELRVSITEASPGWTAQLVSYNYDLEAGASTPVIVTVIPPTDALAGDRLDLTFTATSSGNATKTRSLTLSTVVNQIYGLELSAPVDSLKLLPGDEGDYTLRIVNPGNGPDKYEILIPQGISQGWWGSIPEAYVTLEANSQGDAAFRLAAPNPSPAGTSLEFTLRVKSTKSGLEAPVSLSAEVLQFHENSYKVEMRDVEGEVGTEVTVPVTIENLGNGRVDYVLGATADQEGWREGFANPTVTVEGYEWVQVEMTFTVPQEATAETHTLSIAIQPSGGEGMLHNLTFTVLQYHGLEMEVLSESPTLTQGGTFEVDVRLTNTGNGVEDVKLLVPELPPYWTFDLLKGDLEIRPFDDAYVSLTIHTNVETAGGDYVVGLMARYGPDQSTVGASTSARILTRADLVVVDGALVPSSLVVMEGDLVTASVDIRNTGETAAEDVYVQFFVDGLPYGQPLYLPALEPDEVENLTISWTANVSGLHEISVDVDSTDDVDETREDNNGAAVQVKVESPTYQTSPGYGLLAVVVALAALATVSVRRRHRKG